MLQGWIKDGMMDWQGFGVAQTEWVPLPILTVKIRRMRIARGQTRTEGHEQHTHVMEFPAILRTEVSAKQTHTTLSLWYPCSPSYNKRSHPDVSLVGGIIDI